MEHKKYKDHEYLHEIVECNEEEIKKARDKASLDKQKHIKL